MTQIFVNLKRFDVPRDLGGICPSTNPGRWIGEVIAESVGLGLGRKDGLQVVFLLPEALILPARETLASIGPEQTSGISLGCQGVYRENVAPGKNFGAFTTFLPAAAAVNLGCTWTIVGHSEERRDRTSTMREYDPTLAASPRRCVRAARAVSQLMNAEASCALEAGMSVLVCIGESAEEKGDGSPKEQRSRTMSVLRRQIEASLRGHAEHGSSPNIVVGYEPIWAIGPGKTPPGSEYIAFVSDFIKRTTQRIHGFTPRVVYGGGLKRENAGEIAAVRSVDGGLVALTRFIPPVAFEPHGLAEIVEVYLAGRRRHEDTSL